MSDRTVHVLFGTRPELIKVYPVIHLLRETDGIDVRLICTAQHREMIDDLLALFALTPDHDLDVITPGQSLADISVRIMRGLDEILTDERSDLLIVQGDTTSSLIGALTAFYRRVPVAHIEAGLRSQDLEHPFPEEANRRLITVLAAMHFAPLASNADSLLREGVSPDRILVTGNTVIDALLRVRTDSDGALDRFIAPETLDGKRMVLVTAHRRESFAGPLAELCHALRELADAYPDLVIVYPVHLNPEVQRTVKPILGDHERIRLLEPLPYVSFIEAMDRSCFIITDSGGVQEEAPALGKPVLVFRRVTERTEGLARHGAEIVGLDRQRLITAARNLLDNKNRYQQMQVRRDIYGDGRASERIVQAIRHYFGAGEPPTPFRETDEGK